MKIKGFSAFFTLLPQKIEKKWKGFSWWQKALSVFVSVSLVVPLFLYWNQLAFSAIRDEEFSLVAVLVDEDLYQLGDENKTDTITGKIYRYAEDVQKTMERTKSIVLPVPKNSSSEEIFRILEKWHNEGQKRANDIFFLKGVILVGNVSLPKISVSKGDFESIFPYTDFENPAFLWNEKRKIWVKNSMYSTPQAEIWHGILPGESAEIAKFLDRNHVLHEKLQKGEMPAEEKIFVANFTQERKGAHPTLFAQYQARQEIFQDDISYLRYNKNLLTSAVQKLYATMNPSAGVDDDGDGKKDEDPSDGKDNDGDKKIDEDSGDGFFLVDNDGDGKIDEDLIDGKDNDGDSKTDEDSNVLPLKVMSEDSFAGFPDVSTKTTIDSLLPRYTKVQDGFQKTLSDMVAKTGRWNQSNNGIDSFPQYITLLDEYVAGEIKKLNDAVEKNITTVIQNSMEKPIAVLPSGQVWDYTSGFDGDTVSTLVNMGNFLNGKKVSDIQFPNECSLYRGNFEDSPAQVVVYNALYDPILVKNEGIGICNDLGGCCFLNVNAPQNCNPNLATRPVFSWGGSHSLQKASDILWGSKNIEINTSYLECQRFNFIYTSSGFWGKSSQKKNINVTLGDANATRHISSLVIHNEPKNGTISAVLSQQIPGHLPANVLRYADFQNIHQNYTRIDFPDFFAFRLPEDVKTSAYTQFLAEKFLQTKEWEQAVGLSSQGFLLPKNPKKYTAIFQFFDDGTVKRSHFNTPSSGILPPKFLEDAVLSRATVDTTLDQYLVSALPDPKTLPSNVEMKKLEILGIEDFAPAVSVATEEKREDDPCEWGETPETPIPLPISDADFYQKFSLRTNFSCGTPNKKWVKEGITKTMTTPKQFHQKILAKYSASELDFLLRWKDMTFDEKHDALFLLALDSDQKSFPSLVKKPYAYAHLQVEGDTHPAWKGIDDSLFGGANPFDDWNTDDGDSGNGADDGSANLDEKCGPIEGVPIWEWIPAIMCWLESLKDLGIETTKQCHIDDPNLFDLFEDKKNDWKNNLAGTDVIVSANSDILLFNKENVLGVKVVKNDGKVAKGEMLEVKISVENAKFLDGSTEKIISLLSGEGVFSIIPEHENKQVKISAVAVLEKGEVKKEMEFSVVKNAFLEVKEVGVEEKNGVRKYELVVQAKHEKGDFVFFNAPVSLSVSDQMRAFLSAKTISINEKFSVAVRSEQSVEVLATIPSLLSGKIVLDGTTEISQKIDRVFLPQIPKILDIRSVASSEIVFLNVFAKEFVPEKIEIIPEKNMPKNTKVEWDGKKLWISTGKESGNINFTIKANDIVFPFSIPVAAVFSEEEQKKLNANALYGSLFGLENYGVSLADHPAKKMLYASDHLTTISTLLTSHKTVLPRVRLSKNGKIDIFDDTVAVNVSATSPLRLSVVDEEKFRFLGEFALKMPENSLVRLRAPLADEVGVFFENGESSGNLVSEMVDDTIVLSVENTKIAKIFKNGNVEFFDNRFSLQFFPEVEKEGVSFLLLSNDTPYGKISFVGMEWVPVSSSIGMTASAGKTGWNLGGEKETVALMPEIRNGFSENSKGLGFEGRENFVLQFASGASVGDSTKTSADPFFINFGDPSLALPKTTQNSAGFDETIGKEIVRPEKFQIEQVLPLQFDADDRVDLAVVKSNDEVEIFSQQAKNSWMSRGSALRFSGTKNYFLAGNFNHTGNDDFLLSQNDNQISLFLNENGVLKENILPKNHPLVSENFSAPSAKDIDGDGFVDIVGFDSNSQLSVVYGKAGEGVEGFFEAAKDIGSFAPKLDESNALNDVFISFPDLEKSFAGPYTTFPVGNILSDAEISTAFQKQQINVTGNTITNAQDFSKLTSSLVALDMQNGGEDISRVNFAPISLFSSDFSVMEKKLKDKNGGVLSKGDTILVSIVLESKKNTEIAFADIVSPLFSFVPNSLSCSACDEKTMPRWNEQEKVIVSPKISATAGKKIEISYSLVFQNPAPIRLSLGDYNKDGVLDIFLFADTKSGGSRIVYQSTGKREYEAKVIPADVKPSSSLFDTTDANGNGVPDVFEKDANGNGIADFVEDILAGNSKDTDGDGLPDDWDLSFDLSDPFKNELQKFEKELDKIIDFFGSCKSGGCLNLPINNAFFVPGTFNNISSILGSLTGGAAGGGGGATGTNTGNGMVDGVTGGIAGVANSLDAAVSSVTQPIQQGMSKVLDKVGLPAGLSPNVMPIFAWGPNIFCTGPSCIVFATPPFTVPTIPTGFAMTMGRFYLSPTLTGGLGVAVCKGPGGAYMAPAGACFIQAIPAKFLQSICDKINPALADASSLSFGSGSSVFTVEGTSQAGNSSGTLLQFDLGTMNPSVPSGQNRRVNGTGGFFARWANRQIEEFAAMFTLPALTIYFPDLTGTLYDSKDLVNRWYTIEKKWKGEGFEPKETITAKNVDTEKNSLQSRMDGAVNSAYDALKPADDFLQEAKYRAGSITEFYELLESVPLLQVSRKKIVIQIPSLSRRKMLQMSAEWQAWVDASEAEMNRFGDDGTAIWNQWKSAAGKVWDEKEMLILFALFKEDFAKARELIALVKKNIEMLKYYRELFSYGLAHLDAQVAQYIYSLICYLDAISDLVGGWVLKNKLRYQKWKEFFATARELVKVFQILPKIFNNYESYCKTCQAGNYDQGNFVFNLLGNILPEPPIIKFPRLPDIVLDLSQINAAIHLEVPEISFQPREIQMPSLPPLRLPNFPKDKFSLPEIPELPSFPELPEFPPFPAIELPKLPDLPPPPLIPQIFGSFGSLLSVAEKMMYLYCLIRKGIFVYPETTTKSVIETLTERPANPLSIDFLSQQFPDLKLPSIKEIRVTAEVNLEKDISILTEAAQEMAKEINAQTSDFIDSNRMEFPDSLEKMLDQSGAIDEKTKKNLDVDTHLDTSDMHKETNENLDVKNLLNQLLETEKQKLLEDFKNPEKLVDVSEIRKNLGLPEWKNGVEKPKNPYGDLKKNLVALQSFHENRSEKLLADENFLENFSEDIQNPAVFASEKIVLPTAATEQVVPIANASQNTQNTVKAVDGVYISTETATLRLIASEDMAREMKDFFLIDTEKDGDEDVIYFTKNAIFFKENTTKQEVKEIFSGAVEVANFSNEIPSFQSPKNLKATHFGNKTTISFLPASLEKVKGLEIFLVNSVLDETRNNATIRKRIFVLEKSVFNELTKTFPADTFFTPENDVEILGEKISAKGDMIMLKKISEKKFHFSTKEIQFYSLSARWILKANQRGTFSQTVLAVPKSSDSDAPFSLSDFTKTVFLYKENEISFPEIYDAESEVKIFWDLDNNGSFETEKNSLLVPPEREPTTKKFPLQIVDSAGNILTAEATIHFVAPPVFLHENALKNENIAKITIDPLYANVPISFLRERFGVLKKIITPSGGEKGLWQTNSNGEVQISDFNFSKNAVVKDAKAKILAEFLAHNGKLVSRDSAFHIALLPQKNLEKLPMRQVLLNSENVIVANAVAHTKNAASVGQMNGKFSLENLPTNKNFGTFSYDEDDQDDVIAGPIPNDAPSFPGGIAIFEKSTQKPLALVAPNGNIAFLENANLSLSLLQNAENDPFVAQISHNGKILFSIVLLFSEENIFIDQTKTATGKIAQIFSPNFSQVGALDASVHLRAKNLSPLPFADVPENSKYFDSIAELFSRNLISGYTDGNFYPEKNISRAEFVQIALGVTECLDCLSPSEAEKNRYFEFLPFPDVDVTKWYHFCVAKAKKLGMIMGYKDGLYKPEQPITRAEAVAILLRQAKIPLQNIPNKPMGDVPTDAWYYSAMATGINLGLVESHFGFTFPNQLMTRGEFSKMAYALFQIRDCRKIDSDGDNIPDYVEIYNGKNEKDPFDKGDGNLVDTKDRDFTPIPSTFQNNNSGNNSGNTTNTTGNSGNNSENNSGNSGNNSGNILTPMPESEGDLCPFVPEDKDGVDDADGCPEEDDHSFDDDGSGGNNGGNSSGNGGDGNNGGGNFGGNSEVLVLFKGDLTICGFLDYLADLRNGDIFQAAILKDDETEKFSTSNTVRLEK